MGTTLSMITNATLKKEDRVKKADLIVKKLQELNLNPAKTILKDGTCIEDQGEWTYSFVNDFFPDHTEFESPTPFSLDMYNDITVIDTIYRYHLIYKNYQLDWFESFRREIYEIITILGGTEIIYLADNSCDKLNTFLDLAYENTSYTDIKKQLTQKLGQPVKNYKLLKYNTLSYNNINEFFLDDFSDLRN